MTKEELYHLRSLRKEIKKKQELIESLRERASIRGSQITGMPHNSGVYDRIGETVTSIVDAEQQLQELKNKYYSLEDDVQCWIDGIDDLRISCIFYGRFIEDKSWKEIAAIDCGQSSRLTGEETDVRKICSRYIDKHCES